jgi:hypothetical protein
VFEGLFIKNGADSDAMANAMHTNMFLFDWLKKNFRNYRLFANNNSL